MAGTVLTNSLRRRGRGLGVGLGGAGLVLGRRRRRRGTRHLVLVAHLRTRQTFRYISPIESMNGEALSRHVLIFAGETKIVAFNNLTSLQFINHFLNIVMVT